jgi:curved DNA-binding protein CbpA
MFWKHTAFGYGSVQGLHCARSRAHCFQFPSRWKAHSNPFEYIYCKRHVSVHAENPAADSLWPTTHSFTPYDIFRQEPTAPYSKRRYYELVKVYHPDRQSEEHPQLKNISEEARLQRYRLIVTAHEILSDPEKRAAYDRDGTGWNSHPDHPGSKIYPNMHGNPVDPDTSIFKNGTWEDWERYYNRHKPKQVQIVSHGTFITFVFLLVLFGGFAQASWVTQTQVSIDQKVQEMNAQSARLLAKRRQQTDALRSTEHRVQNFLMRRDPAGSGLKEEEESVYRKALDQERGDHFALQSQSAGTGVLAEMVGPRSKDTSGKRQP